MTMTRLLTLSAALSAACSSQTDTTHPQDLAQRPADLFQRAADMVAISHDMTPARVTTIADARGDHISGTIQVTAVVTAIRDSSNWYIEDLAGGPNSGVAVYSNSPAITPPALHDLITVTGALQTYQGKVELAPASLQTIIGGVPDPAPVMVQAADLDPSGRSQLHGVLVQLSAPLTVDSLTPDKLYDTQCAKGDAGAGALCKGCRPPTYSGFQAKRRRRSRGADRAVLLQQREPAEFAGVPDPARRGAGQAGPDLLDDPRDHGDRHLWRRAGAGADHGHGLHYPMTRRTA